MRAFKYAYMHPLHVKVKTLMFILFMQSKTVDKHHAVISSDLSRNLIRIHDLGSKNGVRQ